jgi:hypothetical protein
MKDRRAGEAVIDKDPSMLWFIHGEAYDLSTFIHSHPGGYLIRRRGDIQTKKGMCWLWSISGLLLIRPVRNPQARVA